MQKIIRFVRLLGLIFRNGKFRHTGADYSKHRKNILRELQEFCPVGSGERHRISRVRKLTSKSSLLSVMIGELAFLRKRLKSQGGHLKAPQINLFYIRIPKAASTAISSSILQVRYPRLKMHILSPEQINYLVDINLATTVMAAERDATFFTVVRNPFARIVSVYRQFFENENEDFLYEDYLFGVFRHIVSFREFVSTLQLIPDLLKDQHLLPQHLFLKYYDSKNIAVRVFKLEEPSAWKDFLRQYLLEVEIIHKTTSPYDYAAYFDQETLDAVLDLYRADVSVFGYESAYRDLQRLIEYPQIAP